MRFDHSIREVRVKIALLGPTGAGKRTIGNIFFPMAEPRGKPQWLDHIDAARRGGAWFFDFLPPKMGTLRGCSVRLAIHSMSEPCTSAALEHTLDEADAILFVADSTRRDANLAALERAAAWGADPDVFVFNKRDCPGIAAADVLAGDLGVGSRPTFEGIATQKVGVVLALKTALRIACTT